MHRRKEEYGFTLFELLIVMAIAAFAIGTVMTFYNPGSSSVDIKSQAFTIASEIAKVRNAAVISQDEKLVSFDISKKAISFGEKGRTQVVSSNTDISITSAAIENRSGNIAGIRFYANGSSTGGTITLRQEKLTYEIRVNWLTGRVSTHKVSNQQSQE